MVVVEDHPVTAAGVRLVLEAGGTFRVVAEAGSWAAALAAVRRERPELVVADLFLDGAAGLDELGGLVEEGARVLVFTMAAEPRLWAQVAAAGVHGLVVKGSEPGALRHAAERIVAGGRWFPGRTDPRRIAREALTRRELQVLRLVAEGLSNREIAAVLGVGPATVKSHVAAVLHKLGARNRAGAVREAVALGLLPGPPGGRSARS